MRTIAVVNQKGGCGKTITSINLSAFLALSGHRVLLVDMDPQGHSTLGVLKEPGDRPGTMYDVFVRAGRSEPTRLGEIVRPVSDRFDLAAADVLLSAAPAALANVNGREHVLAQALDAVRSKYDFVVIDCPPHVGLLTFNALYACTEAIVPMEPSFFSLHGLGKVLETFDVVARHSGHEIVARVLVTLYSGRSPFAKAVVDNMHTHMPGRYFETVIRHSVKLAEAASHGMPITEYSRNCAGYDDYRDLAAEIVGRDGPAASIDEPDEVDAPVMAARGGDQSAAAAFLPSAPSAPSVTPDGVMFSIEAPGAERVQLVGDFNHWMLDGNEMEHAGPVWRKVLKLGPGRYRYRYVVDGEWRSDPLNGELEPCPFGGHDSVLVLDHAPADSAHN